MYMYVLLQYSNCSSLICFNITYNHLSINSNIIVRHHHHHQDISIFIWFLILLLHDIHVPINNNIIIAITIVVISHLSLGWIKCYIKKQGVNKVNEYVSLYMCECNIIKKMQKYCKNCYFLNKNYAFFFSK